MIEIILIIPLAFVLLMFLDLIIDFDKLPDIFPKAKMKKNN